MELLPSEKAQYSAIIDGILAKSDLQTVSAKQIRRELQAALDHDISHQKEAVQKLIHDRFDYISNLSTAPLPTIEVHTTNGHVKSEVTSPKVKHEGKKVKHESTPPSSRAVSDPPSDESDEEISPPKKKKRQAKELDDAKLAAMLQAQENSRLRSTRGGGSKKIQKKTPKKPRKKSEKKVKPDDDSEMEVGSDGEVKEKVKKGGFHKLYHLSAPLAELVGEPTLSRPQVVKKIWEYIKARDLQDPADKRQIRCDETLQAVFKQEKVHMFTMNKILGKQLYDVEE